MIMETFRMVISEQLGVDLEKITAETSFVDDLGTDSLDSVELAMELEEEFGIAVPEGEAKQLRSVGDAIRFILHHEKGDG